MYLTDILRRLSVSRSTTCGITIETAGAHIVCVRFRCCSAVQCGTLGQPFAASTCRSSVPAPVLFCSRIPPPRVPDHPFVKPHPRISELRSFKRPLLPSGLAT